MIDERSAFIRLAVIVERSADDDVAVAVAVDVARCGDRAGESCPGLIALGGPGGCWGEARGRAVIDVGPAFLALSVVV